MKMRELGHVFLEKEVENGTFFGAEMGLFTGGNRGNREDTDYHELNTNFLTTDGHELKHQIRCLGNNRKH